MAAKKNTQRAAQPKAKRPSAKATNTRAKPRQSRPAIINATKKAAAETSSTDWLTTARWVTTSRSKMLAGIFIVLSAVFVCLILWKYPLF